MSFVGERANVQSATRILTALAQPYRFVSLSLTQEPPSDVRRGSPTGVMIGAPFLLVSLIVSMRILALFARDAFAQRRRQAKRRKSAKHGALRIMETGKRNASGQECVVGVPNALVSDYSRVVGIRTL